MYLNISELRKGMMTHGSDYKAIKKAYESKPYVCGDKDDKEAGKIYLETGLNVSDGDAIGWVIHTLSQLSSLLDGCYAISYKKQRGDEVSKANKNHKTICISYTAPKGLVPYLVNKIPCMHAEE